MARTIPEKTTNISRRTVLAGAGAAGLTPLLEPSIALAAAPSLVVYLHLDMKQRALQEMLSSALDGIEVVHEPSPRRCAYLALEMVRDGSVDLVMNGGAAPNFLVRAALDPAVGLRAGRTLSDVSVFEIPGLDRLILVSDILVVATPSLEDKVGIVQNAIDVALALGIAAPKVAILSATEMVNPKIPVSMDAANLAKMAQRGQIRGGIVDGPLALDNAISPESARIKGIESEVAGRADILIAPDAEAGNLLAKAITYFAGGKMASVIVGGQCPLVLPSRSDVPEARLASLALGIYLCCRQ